MLILDATLETSAFLVNLKEFMMALITIGTIIGTWTAVGRQSFQCCKLQRLGSEVIQGSR